ncbi:hypothetical protein BV898_08238 [Hypsibius exemplaris]|uniref:Uncharacterized protein n=2 Tax=Hypsibius TaxID=58670 RepID=A0A1W0WR38_HYPEX|nr:hypothetical protein BV898_08238 [Hypsibius exemplaris]
MFATSSAVWVYLEPRFDGEFLSRNADVIDSISDEMYNQQSAQPALGSGIPIGGAASEMATLPRQMVRPLRIPTVPMQKRNSEILNTLIGLPNKLKQRG